jgi:maltose O-acetyltransferase
VRSGAIIDEQAEIGEITARGDKKNLFIGAFSFLGRVEIGLHEKVWIGNYVCINDGVILLTASHDLFDPEWKHKKAPIIIEDYAWIATNAIILPGVKIGKGAVIGAGAVVSKDVPEFHVAVGNPAQYKARQRITNLSYNPCEFLAANMAWLKG